MDLLEEDDPKSGWKVRQASQTINLFLNNFLEGEVSLLQPNSFGEEKLSMDGFIEMLRDVIRLKHYSVRTQRSYVDWLKRYYRYLSGANSEKPVYSSFWASSVKYYLSHTRKSVFREKVSAYTRNQAFNALLFLFRHVLNKESEGLHSTVRAKKGSRLPVVPKASSCSRLWIIPINFISN